MNYLSHFGTDSDVKNAISKSLLKIRKNNNLTQQKLAEILDVSIEHISRIENCKYTCSINLIFKICTIFKMNIDEFFEIEDSDENNLTKFFKSLSIEKRNAIVEFCKEIEKECDK